MSVKVAFSIGSFVFLTSILYTIFTTKEYPPNEKENKKVNKPWSFSNMVNDIITNVGGMPTTMKKLAAIQFLAGLLFLQCGVWLTLP